MESKIKENRNKILEILEKEQVSFYEWERIRNYIDDKYEATKVESTLKNVLSRN